MAADAAGRPVGQVEVERPVMAEPAGERLVGLFLMPAGDEHPGGTARPGVQVLVGTADREVRTGAVQVHRKGPGGMGEVPQGQRARRMGGPGDGGHVEHGPRLEIGLRQHDHGDRVVDRGLDLLLRHQPQRVPVAELADQPLGHVEVGGEILDIGQDHLALRPHRQRRGEQLEDVDRGGIDHRHLARRGADQPGQPVAQDQRLLHPAVLQPAADEVLAPFLVQHGGHALRHRLGQGAEGVAVEIDQVVGKEESIAEPGQRILGVERSDGVEGDAGHGACRLFCR